MHRTPASTVCPSPSATSPTAHLPPALPRATQCRRVDATATPIWVDVAATPLPPPSVDSAVTHGRRRHLPPPFVDGSGRGRHCRRPVGTPPGSVDAATAMDVSCGLRRFVDATVAVVYKLSYGGWSDVDGRMDLAEAVVLCPVKTLCGSYGKSHTAMESRSSRFDRTAGARTLMDN